MRIKLWYSPFSEQKSYSGSPSPYRAGGFIFPKEAQLRGFFDRRVPGRRLRFSSTVLLLRVCRYSSRCICLIYPDLCKAYESHKAHWSFCAGRWNLAYFVLRIAAVVIVLTGTTSLAGLRAGQYEKGPVQAVVSHCAAPRGGSIGFLVLWRQRCVRSPEVTLPGSSQFEDSTRDAET